MAGGEAMRIDGAGKRIKLRLVSILRANLLRLVKELDCKIGLA